MSEFGEKEDSESEEEEDWGQTLDEDRHPPQLRTSPKSLKAFVPVEAQKADHSRVIVHIDLDCFYAQVEMIHDPSLRDKPLGIQQKNIIVTCNYVARARGLGKLMYLKEAKEKCPDLVLVSGEDLTKYRNTSYKVTELLQRHSRLVERLGMDENYVDVTSMAMSDKWRHTTSTAQTPGHIYGQEAESNSEPCCGCGCKERLRVGAHIAQFLRQELLTELGLTACGGVAHNKLLAKLVGSTHKPNQQTLLPTHCTSQLLLSLGECRKIPGIGSSMSKRLASMGVSSVRDLQLCPLADLEEEFGARTSRFIFDLRVGVDRSEVTPTGRPQSMSDEDSFRKCSDTQDAYQRLDGLIHSLLLRVHEDGRIPQTVRLTVRNLATHPAWHRESRQCPIPASVTAKIRQGDMEGAADGLLQVCTDLFRRLVDVKAAFHLTLLNVAVCNLKDHKADREISAFFHSRSVIEGQKKGRCSETFNDGQSDAGLVDGAQTDKGPGGKSGSDKSDKGGVLVENHRFNMSGVRDTALSDRVGEFCQTATPTHISGRDAREEQPTARTKRTLEDSIHDCKPTPSKKACIEEEESSSSPCVRLSGSPECHAEEPPVVIREKDATRSGASNVDLVAPPGVDTSVFCLLPESVQREVIAQYMETAVSQEERHNVSTNASRYVESHSTTGSSKPSPPSCTSQSNETQASASRPVNEQKTEYQGNSIRSIFNKKVGGGDTTTFDSANTNFHIGGSTQVKGSTEGEMITRCSTQRVPGGEAGDMAESGVLSPVVPSDMDGDVFRQLPADIQAELRAEWTRRRLASKQGMTPGGSTTSHRKQAVTKRRSGQTSLDRFLKRK